MKRQPTEGIVLISKDGYYVSSDGRLPKRPTWDKAFLLWKVRGKRVLCSENTLKTLPSSLLNSVASITTDASEPWDANLGIDTFKHLPDVFYLCKSHLTMNDRQAKELRLDFLKDYQVVCNTPELKIYVRGKISWEK